MDQKWLVDTRGQRTWRKEREDRENKTQKTPCFTHRYNANLTVEQRKTDRKRVRLQEPQTEGIREDFKVQNSSRCCDRT